MLGNILLTLAFAASLFTIAMYYFSYKNYENAKTYARIGYNVMSVAVFVASVLLLYAIVTHQYQYKYVFNYSSSELSTGLLMSTFYAGQEGSFMVWLLFSVIVGLALLEYTSKRGNLEPRVMMIFTLSNAFLLLLVSPMLKNPFTYIWADPTFIDVKNINQSFLGLPFLRSFLFEDTNTGHGLVKMSKELYSLLLANGISIDKFIVEGKGLNPLLQNFWMQIHPPILFIGFAMSAVPFSFAFSSLLDNDYKDWVKQSLPWILATAMVLGLAIMLGGYWAYGVLGWGGWWGWDPVENSSLVPWIIAVALIHTMLVQKKTQAGGGIGRFGKTNLILAIMTFLLVLYSTFLTRSGILGDASVHSFSEPGNLVYWLLIAFVGLFTLLGVGGILYRWKYLEKHFQQKDDLLSRDLALFTGSVALIAAAIIILVGTSAPIFGNAVDISFYNELTLPIGIIIGLLNGFSLLLKWNQNKGKDLLKRSTFSLSAAVISTLLVVFVGGVYDLMLIIFTFAAMFALFVNLEVAFKIIKGKKSFLGAYVAHAGLALILIGIIASGGYSKSEQVKLYKGKAVNVFGYNLTFNGYASFDNDKKFAFNVEVEKNGNRNVISPVMFISSFNGDLMREPDILTRLTKDFYISPLGYEDGGNTENKSVGKTISISKGETADFNNLKITFQRYDVPDMSNIEAGSAITVGAELKVSDGKNTYLIEPKLVSKDGKRTFIPASIPELSLTFKINNLSAGGPLSLNIIDANAAETTTLEQNEYLTVEASVKPFISLIWIGVIVVTFGFVIAVYRRRKESLV
ncbi:MAG: cytochrome c biogenesis protein CcsA [Chlorobi bacterium]|nr:cytochrome c biogenesis protein CcsA [Chlorobiota bacterium]